MTTTNRKQRPATAKPGTRAGVSETIVEMAAESIDPAMWAALQLTKPDQPQPKTVGEVRDRIAAILRQALGMELSARACKTGRPYTTDVIVSHLGAMTFVVRDERGKVVHGTQFKGRRAETRVRDLCDRLNEAFIAGFDTMREAMGIVREVAREVALGEPK